jgi:hypothetical protein
MFRVIVICQDINLGSGIGQIRLYDIKANKFPIGLLVDLLRYFKENDYEFTIDKSLRLQNFDQPLSEFIETVIPNLELEPYDYQMDSFIKCIRLNRALILSPTRIR